MDVLTRRSVLIGMGACACCVGLASPVHARKLTDAAGCVLKRKDSSLMDGRAMQFGRSLSKSGGSTGKGEKIIRTTNDPALDRALDRALKRVADTFGVFPGFGFYDDFDGPNARAMEKTLVPGTKGTVLFGTRLFDILMKYDAAGGAVMWTAAHEFAHIWGFFSGAVDALLDDQPTVKRVELHADFLAGYYLGTRKRENKAVSLYNAGKDIWKSGDTQYNNPSHHGSPDERIAAAEAGFALSFKHNRDADTAFNEGLAYVLKK